MPYRNSCRKQSLGRIAPQGGFGGIAKKCLIQPFFRQGIQPYASYSEKRSTGHSRPFSTGLKEEWGAAWTDEAAEVRQCRLLRSPTKHDMARVVHAAQCATIRAGGKGVPR